MPRSDPLAAYNAKRDFKRTPEPAGSPAGKREASASGNRFIVQKHDAARLHWDLRLEVDGVLKSWAVTRGPSPDPDDKRLAVRTEDHPMGYAGFEGTIPKGELAGFEHTHPWSIGDAAVLLRRAKGKPLAGWGLRREGCRIFEPASSKHTPLMSSEVEGLDMSGNCKCPIDLRRTPARTPPQPPATPVAGGPSA